jgi:hypothetical protein
MTPCVTSRSGVHVFNVIDINVLTVYLSGKFTRGRYLTHQFRLVQVYIRHRKSTSLLLALIRQR